MDRDGTHASTERLQALLDGGLGQAEARAVQEHVSDCARCRSELEAWSTLYAELGALDELAPSPGFTGRVLEALPHAAPRRLPLAARVRTRIRTWLGLERDAEPVVGGRHHLDVGGIQALLDGALAPERAVAMEVHLGRCRLCREEVEGWRGLMLHLDRLPRLEPSPVFAERVMAHVRVQSVVAAARPSLRERLANWVVLNPGTRKRLAAIAGAGVTPAVTVVLVVWSVFSHPLVTPGNLASFLWLKAQGLLAGLASAVGGQLAESTAALQLYSVLEPLTRSAEVTAVALTLLGSLTVVAVWILYRNLFAADSAEYPYARLPF